ncbi:MAG: L-threonylcarbamoyladenylate synthase [Thalassotalea sp.]
MANAVEVFQQGGIIAYPTEAVFGLGCDPDNQAAVEKLLEIKQRPIEKGLILLAANYSQLLPYVDDAKIPQDKRFSVLSRWPDGITQVLPANQNIAKYLTGKFSTIAVRVTSQPDVVALCKVTNKPIVSTSCNLTGGEPAKTYQTIDEQLQTQIDFIIQGETLGYTQPSTIIDGLTGETFRS